MWGLTCFLMPTFPGQLLADLPDAGWMHGAAGLLAREEPVRGLEPSPVSAQQRQQFGREHDLAGLLTFPLSHQEQHSLVIDISDLEIQHLGATQSGCIQRCQQGPMLQILRGIQQGGHFLPAQDGREFRRTLGLATSCTNQPCFSVFV